MTDLEAKLAALTCLWCSKGVPIANGRHQMSNGMEADCDSKAKQSLELCRDNLRTWLEIWEWTEEEIAVALQALK